MLISSLKNLFLVHVYIVCCPRKNQIFIDTCICVNDKKVYISAIEHLLFIQVLRIEQRQFKHNFEQLNLLKVSIF